MNKLALAVFLLAAFLLFASEIEGQADDTDLWLARCFVGEASWNTPDYVPIANVLQRRYLRAKGRFPTWTFKRQIVKYCKSLYGSRTWVAALPPPPLGGAAFPQPRGWSPRYEWKHYYKRWATALEVAKTFRELPDPCPDALHFGSLKLKVDLDNARLNKMVLIDCGETSNGFYRL